MSYEDVDRAKVTVDQIVEIFKVQSKKINEALTNAIHKYEESKKSR